MCGRKKARTAVIERCYAHELREKHGIKKQAILSVFGISRQAQQQQMARQRQREGKEAVILELVRGIRHHHPRLGVRKLLHKLKPNKM